MSNLITSVVVCAFNEEKRLKDCLNSIKSQIIASVENTEIIIVDNDSKDETSNIAIKFIQENDNLMIRYFKIEHVPLTSSRNTAISFCQGNYIVFVDADAIVGDGWLKHILKEFNTNTTIVAGSVSNLNTDSLFAEFIYQSHFKCSLDKKPFIGANMAYKKSVFDHTGGFFSATINRGDETLFLQEYTSNNPDKKIGFAKNSIVYNDFPNTFLEWLKQQYTGGREYLNISKFKNKSLIDVLQEILRAINILFLPHLLIHFFVISSPLYFLHFILFLIRNIYKLKHCYCGSRNLFFKGNIFQAIMFFPVTIMGTLSTDCGFVLQAILSFNKVLDKSNAKVSKVINQIKSNKVE